MVSAHIFHERTLGGAIDSYISKMDHVQPYLAESYETVLEAFADSWIDGGGENLLQAPDAAWLDNYLAKLPLAEKELATEVLTAFYHWTIDQNLVEHSPVGQV